MKGGGAPAIASCMEGRLSNGVVGSDVEKKAILEVLRGVRLQGCERGG